MSGSYTPLPPLSEDPKLLAAQQVRAEYTAMLSEIYNDLRLSDLARAEKVDAAWRSVSEMLPQLANELLAKYKATLDQLAQIIPIGPNVPEGSSPADTSALHAAFRVSLTQARDAERSDLDALYTDAIRFGDDTLLRAVLTAASEAGYGEIMQRWVNTQPPSVGAQFNDLVRIRDFLGGSTTDNLIFIQAFKTPEQPAESLQLPTIQMLTEQSAALNNRGLQAR